MPRREEAFTLIELLVVITILGVLASLVLPLVHAGRREQNKIQCIHRVRNLVGLLEQGERYPGEGGPALLLYLVKKSELRGEDELHSLFCPGDMHESLEGAGGLAAYSDLDLGRKGELGHLTSYAGRDQTRTDCRVVRGGPGAVLLADDSEDHHEGRGYVVGLTGGSITFRDKVDQWKLDRTTAVAPGEGSVVEELRCLAPE
ncbi:MAG: type II secretion system protein [Planctomycetes bacterium]|nr:type II secretion system protein [Planctomycetota bacterium]